MLSPTALHWFGAAGCCVGAGCGVVGGATAGAVVGCAVGAGVGAGFGPRLATTGSNALCGKLGFGGVNPETNVPVCGCGNTVVSGLIMLAGSEPSGPEVAICVSAMGYACDVVVVELLPPASAETNFDSALEKS